MKEVLKTLPSEFEMKYDKVFNRQDNKSIQSKLVSELLRLLRSRYNPTYIQLREWLRSLHKHRRDSYLLNIKGAQDQTNRRVHNNNRVAEV